MVPIIWIAVGVDRAHEVAYRTGELQRVARGAQQQDQALPRLLGEWQVDEVGGLLGGRAVPDGARHADDLHRLAVAAAGLSPQKADALAHRVGLRPVAVRQLLVDDGDARHLGGV
jgi:hypothetical protein